MALKKAQVDLIGLVIIVIIIILLALFGLRLLITQPVNVDEKLSVKANNLMNAIVKVNTCNSNIEEAFISCCSSEFFCGQDACDYLSKEIPKIIGNSIEENYYIELLNQNNKCFSHGNCVNGISSSTYIVKNNDQKYESRVKLCKKS